MTVDDKYSLLSRKNLKQPIQMQLFQKQSQFYHLFLYFRNVHSILNIFKKKITLIADVFPKLRTRNNVVRYMCKKSRFRRLFDRQHGKRAQKLLQSERQHRYHIY